ncbi:MAG TPA: PEP-CTERM sorting domain-containing protein [Acidobacteriaceae bacterium]|nr:PEP-CTERM sorting domain-containing protein [Acidobacteriaceae bacterium]
MGGSGGGFSGSGTLYATSNGDGSYTITGIAGTGVTGLLGPGQFNGNDNQLFPDATPVLDANGLGFTDTMGDTDFDVDLGWSSAMDSYAAYIVDSDGVQMEIPVTFSLTDGMSESQMFATDFVVPTTFDFSFASVTATPEPSSLALLGTGVLALAELIRRRMRA